MRRLCARADSDATTAWVLLIVVLILAPPALASEPKFPPLTGRVVDDAAILNDSTQHELTEMLAEHERATGEQIVVVTLDSLQGFSIEDYGYQLGRHWGIGQKDTNTGALLIVAPRERKVRIEVGYGLEGQLTDAISRTIIDNHILPSFKRGEYNAGVLAGTKSMLQVLGGNPGSIGEPETSPGEHQIDPEADLKLKAMLARINSGPLAVIFPVAMMALWFSPLILWMAFLVFLSQRSKGNHGGSGWDSDDWSSGGSSSGGGSSGGGGGGGFSGGGGSFGGGGASGSW